MNPAEQSPDPRIEPATDQCKGCISEDPVCALDYARDDHGPKCCLCGDPYPLRWHLTAAGGGGSSNNTPSPTYDLPTGDNRINQNELLNLVARAADRAWTDINAKRETDPNVIHRMLLSQRYAIAEEVLKDLAEAGYRITRDP
jgi:hypothetical protein